MGLSSVASSSTSSVATSPRDSASRLPRSAARLFLRHRRIRFRYDLFSRSGLGSMRVAGTPCSSANSKASIPRPPAMSTTPAPSPTSRSIPKVSTSQRAKTALCFDLAASPEAPCATSSSSTAAVAAARGGCRRARGGASPIASRRRVAGRTPGPNIGQSPPTRGT